MNRLASRFLAVALASFFIFAGVASAADLGALAPPPTATSFWDLVCDAWNAISSSLSQVKDGQGTPLNGGSSQSEAGSSLDPFGQPSPPPSGTNGSGTGGS